MTGEMRFRSLAREVGGRTIRRGGSVTVTARQVPRHPPPLALSDSIDDPRIREFERLPTPGPRPVAENPRSDAVKRRAALVQERLRPTTQAPRDDPNFPLRRDTAKAALGLHRREPSPQARAAARALWGEQGAAEKGF